MLVINTFPTGKGNSILPRPSSRSELAQNVNHHSECNIYIIQADISKHFLIKKKKKRS